MAVTGLGLDLQSKPSKQVLEASQERDSEGRCWKLELGLSSFGLKPKRCSNSMGLAVPSGIAVTAVTLAGVGVIWLCVYSSQTDLEL